MTTGERQRTCFGLAFVSPWLLGVAVFTIYPVAASLYYSFCDYDVLSRPVWIGLLNYSDMASDRVFWQSVANTLIFNLIALPLGLVFALALALLLNQPVRARGGFRAIYYLPSLVPAVAGAMIWLWILNGRLGLLNSALGLVGIHHPPQWLADPAWTKPSLALMSLWGCGNTVVIYLAALQGVPRSLLEAGSLLCALPLPERLRIPPDGVRLRDGMDAVPPDPGAHVGGVAFLTPARALPGGLGIHARSRQAFHVRAPHRGGGHLHHAVRLDALHGPEAA